MSNLIEKFLIIVYIKRLSILIFTFRNEKDNGIEEEEKSIAIYTHAHSCSNKKKCDSMRMKPKVIFKTLLKFIRNFFIICFQYLIK